MTRMRGYILTQLIGLNDRCENFPSNGFRNNVSRDTSLYRIISENMNGNARVVEMHESSRKKFAIPDDLSSGLTTR